MLKKLIVHFNGFVMQFLRIGIKILLIQIIRLVRRFVWADGLPEEQDYFRLAEIV